MNVIGYISNYIPQHGDININNGEDLKQQQQQKQHGDTADGRLIDGNVIEEEEEDEEDEEEEEGKDDKGNKGEDYKEERENENSNNDTEMSDESDQSSSSASRLPNIDDNAHTEVIDTVLVHAKIGEGKIVENTDPILNNNKDSYRVSLIIWKIFIFLPNILILKPILFIWSIITFPLTIIEKISTYTSSSSSNKKSSQSGEITDNNNDNNNNNNNNNNNGNADLSNGSSLTLTTDYIKQSTVPLKASSPNFGGKFFFPKKLIPNSIINNPNKRKTLVLDLDETLIHSVSKTSNMSNKAHVIEVQFVPTSIPPIFQNTTQLKKRKKNGSSGGSSSNVISTLYYVNKRPYCDLFLNKVCKWYDVVIFTASIKEYADPVINWLESSTRARFMKRLYRKECQLRDGIGYVKNLDVLQQHSSLDDIIIIDNSPVSYAQNIDNAIHVESWINDPSDSDLLQLLPFLEAMRYTTDVKTLLCLKRGEEVFTQ